MSWMFSSSNPYMQASGPLVAGSLIISPGLSQIAGKLTLSFNFGSGLNYFSSDGTIDTVAMEQEGPVFKKNSMTGVFTFKWLAPL